MTVKNYVNVILNEHFALPQFRFGSNPEFYTYCSGNLLLTKYNPFGVPFQKKTEKRLNSYFSSSKICETKFLDDKVITPVYPALKCSRLS